MKEQIPGVKVGVESMNHFTGDLTDVIIKYPSKVHEGMEMVITLTTPDASLEAEINWLGMVSSLMAIIKEHEERGPHVHKDTS